MSNLSTRARSVLEQSMGLSVDRYVVRLSQTLQVVTTLLESRKTTRDATTGLSRRASAMWELFALAGVCDFDLELAVETVKLETQTSGLNWFRDLDAIVAAIAEWARPPHAMAALIRACSCAFIVLELEAMDSGEISPVAQVLRYIGDQEVRSLAQRAGS